MTQRDFKYLELPKPYLLFLGDVTEPAFAKTAFGLVHWAADLCIGECALSESTITTGLPRLSPVEARERGARSLIIGVANRGGAVAPSWIPLLLQALETGLDIVGGMHGRLARYRELAEGAQRWGRQLFDVREPPSNIPIATGVKRSGKRLLTVGTDCALGKKYTALALSQAFKALGIDADFRATGQTGIMIAGSGIPIDAVVADFVAGAAEMLSPESADDHWDVVEGQGSIFHPSYAGVSLGLLHGTQPDVLVLCHEVGRDTMVGLDGYRTPDIAEAIDLHLRLARRTNSRAKFAGISLNTCGLNQAQSAATLAACSHKYGMPAADPLRPGAELDRLVKACLYDNRKDEGT